MVITVLLKVAATCATPEVMFFLSLRRGRAAAAGLAIVYCAPFIAARDGDRAVAKIQTDGMSLFGDFLLARDRNRLAFTGTCVGMRALTAHRQALAMAQCAVAAEVHQPLDVHRDFTPLITLDLIFTVDQFANPQNFVVRELVHP